MSKTRVALIGCGAIGRTHARAFSANGDLCEIVAVIYATGWRILNMLNLPALLAMSLAIVMLHRRPVRFA